MLMSKFRGLTCMNVSNFIRIDQLILLAAISIFLYLYICCYLLPVQKNERKHKTVPPLFVLGNVIHRGKSPRSCEPKDILFACFSYV